MDSTFAYSQINEAVIQIKSYKEGFITNFFIGESRCVYLIKHQLLFQFSTDKCTLVLLKDHNFYHIYYIATCKDELRKALSKCLNKYSSIVFTVDLVGGEAIVNDFALLFEQVGFVRYTRLFRMNRIKGLGESQELDNRVKYAKVDQATQVKELLESYFDQYSEQIPLIDEINEWINNHKISVIVEQDKIIGFVIFEINGITSYLRYWFTHPDYRDRKVGAALLRHFFHNCKDTKRQLFWVIEENENAIKRYCHYGFIKENMYDIVMIKNETTNY